MNMNVLDTPVIPEELQPYFAGGVQDAWELYRDMSRPEVMMRRDKVLRSARRVQRNSRTTRWYIINPSNSNMSDPESDEALVTGQPLGIDLQPPQYLRGELIATAVGKRTLVLPNSRTSSSIHLSLPERRRVISGDVTPVIDAQCRALEDAGITKLHFSSYSLGTVMGPGLAAAITRKGAADVKTAMFADWPNGESRSLAQLLKDFGATTTEDLARAIRADALPVHTELTHAGASVLARFRQQLSLADYSIGLLRSPTPALSFAAGHDTFNDYLCQLVDTSPSTKVLLARAGDSKILSAESFEKTIRMFSDNDAVETITVAGYGHELDDSFVARACLTEMAIRRAGK